ncbi:hypothetical protein PanWU01x14_118160, partial [Parasponia andersonii]
PEHKQKGRGTKSASQKTKEGGPSPHYSKNIKKIQVLCGSARAAIYSFGSILPLTLDKLDHVLTKDGEVKVRMLAEDVKNDGRRGMSLALSSSSLTSVALNSSTAL